MSRLVVALCVFVWLLPVSSRAASSPPQSPEALAARSDRVVVAHVTHTRTEGEGAGLRTVTTLRVQASWKGDGPADVQVVQLGGAAGGYRMQVAGDARLVPGEDVVVFLRCRDREVPARCTLVGLSQGRLKIHRQGDGEAQVELRAKGRAVAERLSLEQLRARLEATQTPGPGPRVLVPTSEEVSR